MKKIKIYLIISISLLLGFSIINFVTGYFSDRVEVYIRQKSAVLSTTLIEDVIRQSVVNKIDESTLITINNNSDNTVKSVIINTNTVNGILADVNASIKEVIADIENEELELPFGIILSDTLFGDTGPSINIKIIPSPFIITDLVSNVTPYGINSSLLEISIKIHFEYETIIPLRRNISKLDFNIPLVITVLNSEVPQIYLMNKS